MKILVTSRDQERLGIAFARDLKRVGIVASIRVVDAVQFDRRKISYDFDMLPYRWDESLSPGNEQTFYWGAAAADIDGTRNYMGVKSKAIDFMISELLRAREREEFVSAVRALDRLLISGFYVVPLFHLPDQWVAVGLRSNIRRRHRYSAICRRPGGESPERRERMMDGGKALERSNALDALFRANVARDPDAIALLDPPNSEAITGNPPRRLSYAKADGMIGSLAGLLRQFGIPEGGVVAIQLPNNADSVIAFLAVARAGMVPAMVPLLWRRAECVAALSRAHAKAIICCGRVGDFDHGQLALDVAAELFPIRAVCGFGRGLPDGIVAIDEIADTTETADRIETFPDIAAITFDMGTDGPVPVERDAVQLLSAGLLVGSQAGVSRGAAILSTVPISSYAGLSASLLLG